MAADRAPGNPPAEAPPEGDAGPPAGALEGVEAVAAVLAAAEPRVYLLHRQADPDALGAAYALARRWPGTILAQGGMAAPARRLAERLGVQVAAAYPPEVALGIAVDTGSPGTLGPLPPGLPLVVVDHHAWAGEEAWPGLVARLVEPEATSTCEVVLPLLWALGEGLREDEAFALLCGVITDTQRFRLATKDTLTAAFVLMDQGASLPEAIALLERPRTEDRSERIARLRAAQRAELGEAHGLVVATAQVGAFESQAADGLVALGADVALVAAERGPQGSVSIRLRREVEARLSAAELAREAAAEVGGGWSGGGHPGAAGLNGPSPAGAVLAACRAVVERMARPR